MANIFLVWVFTFFVGQQQITGNELLVEVTNISSAKGKILIALFTRPNGFPQQSQNAFAVKSVPAAKGRISVSFAGIPTGTCAVAVYHDANNDGKLNTNALGIPKEAYGFSNNARPMFSAPTFEDAGIVVNQAHAISIGLK
jgi:uncharacterized protein (DUF2141 family)